MSYTHFQSEILPSPFLATDQIINTLVYGSFYDIPDNTLSTFLIPKTELGTSQSYLLGALYSYLFRETGYKKVLYIRLGDYTTPLSSDDSGSEFVLGKSITYDHALLSQHLGLEYEKIVDFGTDSSIWAQHLYYQSVGSMEVLPLCLPYTRLQEDSHRSLLNNLLSDIRIQKDTACILIDDFEIKFDRGNNITILAKHKSLSDFYANFAEGNGQKISLLMDQPSYDGSDPDTSYAALGLS